MDRHELTDIITRTGLSKTLVNPRRVRIERIVQEAFTGSGHLRPEVVGQAVSLARDFDIPGIASTGTNVAQQRRVAQASHVVRLEAIAKTPPVGGEFTASLYADGAFVGSVSISNGQSVGISTLSVAVSAGELLTWNVSAANGAANVSLTVSLTPS